MTRKKADPPEDWKGILDFYGSGIWKGDLKAMRCSRVGRGFRPAGRRRGGSGRSER